jgi:hypothetical protein
MPYSSGWEQVIGIGNSGDTLKQVVIESLDK